MAITEREKKVSSEKHRIFLKCCNWNKRHNFVLLQAYETLFSWCSANVVCANRCCRRREREQRHVHRVQRRGGDGAAALAGRPGRPRGPGGGTSWCGPRRTALAPAQPLRHRQPHRCCRPQRRVTASRFYLKKWVYAGFSLLTRSAFRLA